MYKKIVQYGLKFNKSITKWDEALPLGNGVLGCLMYGDGPLKFAIDRIDLWDNRKIEKVDSKNFTYERLVKLANGDKSDWAEKINDFDIRPRVEYPTKLSAGRIIVDIDENASDFKSELSIKDAIATITTTKTKVTSFVSATERVGVIRLTGNGKFKIHIPSYISGCVDDLQNEQKNGMCCCDLHLNYPIAQFVKDNEFTYYVQRTHTDYSYALIILEKKVGSLIELYYTVTTTDDSNDFVEYGKSILKKARDKGYECLYFEHKKYWQKYWSRSNICIGDEEIEKTYYRAWYFFASTSAKNGYPMPLQGVWTADNDCLPPWKGDYHYDTNVQMSYWGYGRANRLNNGKVLVDYLWKIRNKFRNFAKTFYNADGYLVPATASINGDYMGGWSQFTLSPTMSIWVAKAFDDYFYYSDDKNFLKTRAYPFFKSVETAIKSLFIEKDGKLYLPLSTSPEIYEEKQENYMIGNTNFDQSLILYLYKTLIKYCKILNIDDKEYSKTLKKLDDLYLSENKVLMLSQKMNLPFSHRHFSHMMAIHPLDMLNYNTEDNRQIIDNTMLEIEQLGTGWWVGFSFPWCATMYAKMYNGNASYEKLRAFNKGFLSQNGFHLNGDYKDYGFSQWHYRPFTLEALFAYAEAVQEMLIQDDKGYVELFPAIPNDWENTLSFNKLRTAHGVLVSAKMTNGNVKELSFISHKTTTIKIKLNGFGAVYYTNKNNKNIAENNGDLYTLILNKGTTKVSFS